jgi:hypothetical protein
MRMVDADCSRVEAALQAGELACPVCFQPLSPWGWGRRRCLRTHEGLLSTKPRRSICYACVKTHILLPTVALLRRFDVAEAIGEALALKAAGWGHRRIAAGFGIPSTTVRDWLRRFALRAEAIRVHFTALAYLIDSSLGAIEPRGSPQGDAVEAMVVAADCTARRFGPVPLWRFVSGATGGRLLSNTSSPFPALQ